MTDALPALPVHGYRPQSQDKVDAVNANKILEAQVLKAVDETAGVEGTDPRWLSIARTHLEQGFMALNRSIFRPDRAQLPDDRRSGGSAARAADQPSPNTSTGGGP